MIQPIKLGSVLTSEKVDGEIRVQLGDPDKGIATDNQVPLWAADGFFGVPNDATPEGECMVLYQIDGNQPQVLACKDNRFISKYAELEAGDRAIVTDGPTRFFMKRSTNAISLYTETDDGKPIVVDVAGKTGLVSIHVEGGDGPSDVEIDTGEIRLSAGGSSLTIGADGVTITGPHFAANTFGGNLGIEKTGSVPLEVTSVALGPAPGGSPVAAVSASWTVAAT